LLTKLGEVGYKTIKKKKDWTAEELEWCVETHVCRNTSTRSKAAVFTSNGVYYGPWNKVLCTRCGQTGQAGREVSISQLDR